MSKTKPRQIKLFYPHAEVRIFVTDEMIKDYKECKECKEYAKQLHHIDPITGKEKEIKQCKDCSWNNCEIFKDFILCEIVELEEKMDELISEGE